MRHNPESIELEIRGHRVYCAVRRSRRSKNIAIRINQTGLFELVIPERGSFDDARAFLESKKSFLEKHLDLIVRKEDSPFKLFGEEIKVDHHYNLFLRKHLVNFNKDTSQLTIESPAGAKETTTDLYKAWLSSTAAKFLIPRAEFMAQKHGFTPSAIKVKKMRGKWGFCTTKKEIYLSPQLMSLEPDLIDYVIAHELCHLKEMNHSPRFYAELERIYPNYKAMRKRIGRKVF